jgi:HEAT repeat protein
VAAALSAVPQDLAPASSPSPEEVYASLLLPSAGDLPARTADAVRQCAAALAAGGDAASAAQERLLEIQRAVLATLDPYVDDADLEVRLRVGEVLDEMIVEARVTRMIASLPPDQRSRMLQFRQSQPAIFALMMSQDWNQRVKAVGKLTRQSDPQRLAEPLVVLCLRHHSTELVTRAAEAVQRCDYRSDAVVEALAGALGRYQGEPEVRYGRYGRGVLSPALTICEALGNIASPRSARALIDALPGGAHSVGGNSSLIAPLIDALVSTGEKRAIPTLLDRLNGDDRSGRTTWSFESGTATTQTSDYAFYAILRLTSQAPSEYKMLVVASSPFNAFPGGRFSIGFAREKEKDRKDAYEKLKNWWAAAREKQPYTGLTSLEPPAKSQRGGDPSGPQRGGESSGGGEPRSQPATAPQVSATPKDAGGDSNARSAAAAASPSPAAGPARQVRPSASPLPPPAFSAEVTAATRRYADTFRSGSFSVRDAVRHRLLDLYAATLQGLADGVEDRDSESGKRLLDSLSEAVTEASIHAAGFQLPPDLRAKLSAFLAAQPKIARAAFNLNWSARAEAGDALAGLSDPNALAEPIVLLYLKDPTPQIAQSALKLAGKGNYRSDAVVDALTDMLAGSTEEEWGRSTYSGGGPDNPVGAILDALTRIRSPRPAPMLLALWMQRSARNDAFTPALADAMVATGDLGIMPHLLGKLRENQTSMSTTTGKGKAITCAPCDGPLLVLVRLARQDPNDYQFMVATDVGNARVGFKDDATRKAALKKFDDWWKKARLAPPYRDLKPPRIPDLIGPNPNGPGSDSEQ